MKHGKVEGHFGQQGTASAAPPGPSTAEVREAEEKPTVTDDGATGQRPEGEEPDDNFSTKG